MAKFTYGFDGPEALFEKLKREGAKLGEKSEPDDIFNFLVTGASLNEWVTGALRGDPWVDEIAVSLRPGGTWEQLPSISSSWIKDDSCIPNKHCDVRRHIHNALKICWDAAAMSKHFHAKGGGIRGVSTEPIVRNWYQYFFTSLRPDLYIDYEGEVYGLLQVRDILVQFYEGLLIETKGGAGAI